MSARWRRVEQHGGRIEPVHGRLELIESTLRQVDLSELRLDIFRASSTQFDHCDFSRFVVTERGSMSPVGSTTVYRGCQMIRTDLRAVFPGTARFERCRFERARLDGWVCERAEFVDCVFVGELVDVVFSGAITSEQGRQIVGRERNEFRGNDFSGASLNYVGFQGGIDLDAQRLPSGEEYVEVRDFPTKLAKAREAVAAWPDEGRDGERDLAERMLTRYAIGRDTQEVLFARRRESAGVPAEVEDRVWALLEAG